MGRREKPHRHWDPKVGSLGQRCPECQVSLSVPKNPRGAARRGVPQEQRTERGGWWGRGSSRGDPGSSRTPGPVRQEMPTDICWFQRETLRVSPSGARLIVCYRVASNVPCPAGTSCSSPARTLCAPVSWFLNLPGVRLHFQHFRHLCSKRPQAASDKAALGFPDTHRGEDPPPVSLSYRRTLHAPLWKKHASSQVLASTENAHEMENMWSVVFPQSFSS